MSDARPVFACTCGVAWGTVEGPCVCEVPAHFSGESDPIATNPILRGVDLAIDRLVRHDCFTERTLSILDELRAEVAGASTPDELRANYQTT
jgi:hypothetical protein